MTRRTMAYVTVAIAIAIAIAIAVAITLRPPEHHSGKFHPDQKDSSESKHQEGIASVRFVSVP